MFVFWYVYYGIMGLCLGLILSWCIIGKKCVLGIYFNVFKLWYVLIIFCRLWGFGLLNLVL